ncbi:MAG TPA: SDR family oxidoreductase [Limnochordia bacterium]
MNRSALVTGGSGGIGRMIAETLCEKGFDVAVAYHRGRERAEAVLSRLRARGRRAVALQADVADPAACTALVEDTVAALGALHVLVHAAGPFLWRTSTLATPPADWHRLVAANLSSTFFLARAAIPRMREQGWGRIITFGFAGADHAFGSSPMAAYAAAKVGVVSLSRSLAFEEAPHGITVNVICPGVIEERWKERRIADARGHRSPWSRVGRPGTGEDVARVVAFLCEEESDFLTGAVITVGGGLFVGHAFDSPEPPGAGSPPPRAGQGEAG